MSILEDIKKLATSIVDKCSDELGEKKETELQFGEEWAIGDEKWIGESRYMCIRTRECYKCCFYNYNKYKNGAECHCDVSIFGPCGAENRTDSTSVRFEVTAGKNISFNKKLTQGGAV